MNSEQESVYDCSDSFPNLSEIIENFQSKYSRPTFITPSKKLISSNVFNFPSKNEFESLQNMSSSEMKSKKSCLINNKFKALRISSRFDNFDNNENITQLKSPTLKANLSKSNGNSPLTKRKASYRFAPQKNSSLIKNLQKVIQDNDSEKDFSKALEKKNKIYLLISNFYLVRKFINILKCITSKRSTKYLNKYHFEIINDKSFSYDAHINKHDVKTMISSQKFKKTKLSTVLSDYLKILCSNLNNVIPIFEINKVYISIWNFFVVLSMLFFFIYIPIMSCFDEHEVKNFEPFVICKFFSLLILLLDILKCLNTSFYKQGTLIIKRKEIALDYARNYLLIDFLSLGPIIVYEISNILEIHEIASSISCFSTFLFYLKLSHFQEILKKFEEMIFIDKFFHNTLSLVKLIFRILLLSHIFACFWYAIGKNSSFDDNWLVKYDIADKEIWVKYLYSYYFVSITMNTVGYGDITPQNPLEVLFTTVFIYLACGVFAYSLNSIGIIVNDFTKRQNEFSKELNIINSFMHEKNVNFQLRMRVRKYLEYIFHEDKIEKIEEQGKIINKLSDNLKEELMIEANGAIIRDIKFFSLNFTEDTLRKTVSIMKEARHTPGDIIFSINESNNKDLFIIRKGTVELFLENENSSNDITVIKNLKAGDIFGEKSFFTNKERNISARSTDFTTIYFINQEEFISILKKNSKDYERFCEIKDRINIYNDNSFLFIKCPSCKIDSHLIEYCPTLHYVPINDIIIQKYLFNPPQERQIFNREKRRRFHVLRNLRAILKGAQEMQEILSPNIESEDEEENENFNMTSSDSTNYNLKEDGPLKTLSKTLSTVKDDEEINEVIKDNEESSSSFHEFLKDPNKLRLNRVNSNKNTTKLLSMKRKKTNSKTLIENLNNQVIETIENEIKFGNKQEMNEDLIKLIPATSKRIPSGNNLNPKLGSNGHILPLLYKVIDCLKYSKNNSLNENNTFSSLFPNENDHKMTCINTNSNNEEVDIDGLKSYEEYFPEGNIEYVLEKIEHKRRKYIYKKIKKSKSIYSRLNIANKELMENEINFKEKSRFLESTAGIRVKAKHNIMRRNFFKNSSNLEKLINDELFNPEKLKDYYIKKYASPNKNIFFEKLKSLWQKVTKTKPAKKRRFGIRNIKNCK